MKTTNECGQNSHSWQCPRIGSLAIGVALIAAISFSQSSGAAVVTLHPVADNWISSCASGCGVNKGSGTEMRIRTAALWGTIKNFRSLLKFDLCDLPVDGSGIASATLGLHYHAYYWGNPVGRTYAVYRLTSSWDELGSTWEARDGCGTGSPLYWDSYLSGIPSYQPGGGDFDASEYATSEVPDIGDGEPFDETWITWDVTELVLEWVNQEHPDDGLLIKDTDEFEQYGSVDVAWGPAVFASGDSCSENLWPFLEITFTLRGDYDDDGDVDLDDFTYWADCVTGPDNGPCDDACNAFDFDGDTDVDLTDFAAFQLAFTGE